MQKKVLMPSRIINISYCFFKLVHKDSQVLSTPTTQCFSRGADSCLANHSIFFFQPLKFPCL